MQISSFSIAIFSPVMSKISVIRKCCSPSWAARKSIVPKISQEKLTLEDLRGKAVLITGASIGIGAAAALEFGRQGANVAVHNNKNAEAAEAICAAIRKLGGKAVAIGGDLGISGTAKRVVEEAAKQLGRLDILLNNAGAMIRRAPFLELDTE